MILTQEVREYNFRFACGIWVSEPPILVDRTRVSSVVDLAYFAGIRTTNRTPYPIPPRRADRPYTALEGPINRAST